MKVFLFSVCMFAVSVVTTRGQTVDDVITGYVDFTGGRAQWKGVSTIITTGEYNYGGMPFPFTTYSKAPNLYKFIVPLNGKFYEQAYDGKKGWKIDAFKNETKVTRLTGVDAKAMANEADVELESALIDYSSKGHKAEVLMKDSLNGTTCDVVRLTRKDGITEDFYIDEQTHELLAKVALSRNAEMRGTPLKILYSDYREVDGLKVPFKTVCMSEEQTILTITLTDVKINTLIGNDVFQPK